MSAVRCAVIGAGWWGTTAHVPALKAHPDAELIAVQHENLTQARRIARDFDIPNASANVDEVLSLANLQAVVVSSTPNAHFAQVRAALERGLHVLVEKPMTLLAAEAQQLVDLARERKCELLISCPWHYTPHALEAQRLIQSGALGKLKMISILMTNFTMGLYQGKPWDQVFGDSPTLQNASKPYMEPSRASYSDPTIAGGGQIYCQVSHVAAYIAFLTGRQHGNVFARFDNAGTAVDVYDALNVQLEDGTLVNIASHGATMLSDRQYEVSIFGTEGMIQLELWKGKMRFHDRACNVTEFPDVPEVDIYPMFAPTNNLVNVVAGHESNGSPAEAGLFAMRLIEASVRSAQSQCPVDF